MKDRCVGVVVRPVPYDGSQYRWLCYSDIYVLHFVRNFDDAPIPYVDGSGMLDDQRTDTGHPTEVGDLEYPVGTGLVVAAAALLTSDARAFFAVTALILAIAGVATAMALGRMTGDDRRVLFFALAPSLVLYAFHNWDLVAVALATAGLAAFHARRTTAAGVLLGLGAAAKLYPALLVVPLGLTLARRKDIAAAVRLLAASAGTFLAINLPFAIANPSGWWFPFDFQTTRFPNFETSWYFLYERAEGLWRALGVDPSAEGYGVFTARASVALLVLGTIVLVVLEMRRPRVRPYALGLELVLLFLLTAKVFSPQYALWVLPFFVLVRLPLYSFVAFSVVEASVWISIAAYFVAREHGQGADEARLAVVEIAVWARYAVLAWLLWLSRRAPEVIDGDAADRSVVLPA